MTSGNPALVDQLRADLIAASFTVDALDPLWGEDAAAALHRGHRVPAFRALARATIGETSLATLARIFVLGIPVTVEALDAALPSLTTAGAEALDLVVREGRAGTGDAVRPRLDLRPYSAVDTAGVAAWWIASDLGELALGRAVPEDHVLGVGGRLHTLSGLMIPTAGRARCSTSAPDAASRPCMPRATPRGWSPPTSRERALELAALNAALNGVDSTSGSAACSSRSRGSGSATSSPTRRS